MTASVQSPADVVNIALRKIGYKGRIGIYEILAMSPDIEKVILSGNVSEYQMRDIAKAAGMITMENRMTSAASAIHSRAVAAHGCRMRNIGSLSAEAPEAAGARRDRGRQGSTASQRKPGRSGRSIVWPASACVQSARNCIRPAVTKL